MRTSAPMTAAIRPPAPASTRPTPGHVPTRGIRAPWTSVAAGQGPRPPHTHPDPGLNAEDTHDHDGPTRHNTALLCDRALHLGGRSDEPRVRRSDHSRERDREGHQGRDPHRPRRDELADEGTEAPPP